MAMAPGDARSAIPPARIETGSPITPPPHRHQYEFNATEDRIIQDLGAKMSFVGLFMVGIGLCFAISTIQRWSKLREIEVGLIFLSMLFAVFGIWTHRAGSDFRRVAESRGRDVTHLMSALATLLSCYRLIYLICFVALVFAVIQLAATSLGG